MYERLLEIPKPAYNPMLTLLVGPFSEDEALGEVTALLGRYAKVNRAMIIPNPDENAPKDNRFVAYCALVEFAYRDEVEALCTAIQEWRVYLPKNRDDGLKFGAKFVIRSELGQELKDAWGIKVYNSARDGTVNEYSKPLSTNNNFKPSATTNNTTRNSKRNSRKSKSFRDSTGKVYTKEDLDADLDEYRAQANSLLATGPQPQLHQHHNSVSTNSTNTRNSNNKRGSRNGSSHKPTPESLDTQLLRHHAQAPEVPRIGNQDSLSPLANHSVNAKKAKKNKRGKSKKPKKDTGKLPPKASNEMVPAGQRKSKSASAYVAVPSVGYDTVDTVVDEWADTTDVAYASVGLSEVETVVDEWAEAEVETDHAVDSEAVVECNVILGNQAMLSDGEVLEVVAEFAENPLESADIAGEHIQVVTTADRKESKGVHQEAIFADFAPLEPVSEIVNDPSETTREMEETPVSAVSDGIQDAENPCDIIMDCEVIKNVEAMATEIEKEVVELVEKDEKSDHGETVDGESCDNPIDNVVDNMVVSVTEVEGNVEMEAVAADIVTEVAELVTGGVDEKTEGGEEGNVESCDDVIEKVDARVASVDVDGFKSEECGEVELVEFMEEEGKVVMMTGAETSAELSVSDVGEKFESGDDRVVESCADVIEKADVEFGL
ncbi:hypothetical protein HDU76_006654, partial [Blyttiomyces sp. JEL0837]